VDCESIISDGDIKSIYEKSELAILKMECFCEENNTKKSVDVDLGYEGEELLEMPVTRDYFLSKQLINKNISAKVACHLSFIIKKDYRRQGLSKTVHENELVVYKNNNFQQIHLLAAADGLVVWNRLFYKFAKNSDEKLLLMRLRAYLREIKQFDDSKVEKILKLKIAEMDISYFCDENMNFTDWLKKEETILTAVMYKEVA